MKCFKKSLSFIVAFVMLLGLVAPGLSNSIAYAESWKPETEQPIIVVTGDGIGSSNERSYTLNELLSMTQATNLYSTINTTPTKSIFLGRGVKVNDLLSKSNFIKDKYNEYPIAFVARDGYKVTFDPTFKGDSTTSKKLITPSFGLERYYFPKLSNGVETGKVTVDTILAFERAGERGASDVIPQTSSLEKLSDDDAPLLMVGQQHVNEQSNPLFNKTIHKILVGSEMPTVFKIGNKEYTKADILLMPRVSGNWTYMKKSGPETNYVVGVPLSSLFKDYDDKDKVEFIAADGYPNDPVTIADIRDASNQYVLVYEVGTSESDVKAVYDTAKNDSSIEGYFRIYSQNGQQIKLVNEIKVSSSSGVDYSTSSYKHITNGGLEGDAPYDVDAITGATLTFEGPGLETSIPVSIRELESQDAGAFRGDYVDLRDGSEVTLKYEGINLNHLLKNMKSGTTGIKLTDTAYKVILKNRVRQSIAEFTLAQVEEAEAKGKPIIIAYGTSIADGTNTRPFVYDGGAGADSKLGNEDGCIKLVYDKSIFNIDPNPEYTKFGNVAYVYVAENDSPGYKHDKTPYDTPENSQYIISLTGDKLGREVNYTVQQLEDMVEYKDGALVPDGMGHRDEYSLSNSTYWYVNEYEGVKLWNLLKKAGIPETMAKGKDSSTLVQFTATDGYKDFDKFTIGQIADPSLFGYYEKNPNDLNDGKYVSKPADDLRSTGYPVLVAYGVNGYPYVIDNDLDGYKSGLGNDGGPLRIISGKIEYSHANGSKQAKLLEKIIVGNEVNYSAHIGNSNKDYKALASNEVAVKVIGMDGSTLKNQSYKVADIENMIYGSTVSNKERIKAKIKDFYGVQKGDKVYEDLYEGVNLGYFLKEKIEIPGNKGTVTFTGIDSSITVTLDEILSGSSILAFAKNGTPMVFDKNSAGYESSYIDGTGEKINVKNDGGPLMMILPQTEEQKANNTAISLSGVTSITINLQPDKYAHLESPYNQLADKTITVEGPGTKLSTPKTFKVSDLEGKQSIVVTGNYNIKKETSEQQTRYRGIDLYSFLRSVDVGLQSNASEVVITSSDGYSLTLPLDDIMKADYINSVTNESNLKVILAYGSSSVDNVNLEDGKPLVDSKDSAGYDKAYNNSRGPICLVVGQKSADDINSSKMIKDVAKITVKASATTSWKHDMSPTYSQYLDKTTLEITGSALVEPKKYTLRELEAMDDIIIRDSYTYIGEHQHEGIDLWKLITEKAGLKPGAEFTAVKVVASDGFSRDVLSVFGKDALENGIADGLDRKKIILSYAGDGKPLVTDTNSDGYTSGNDGGPIRMITHLNQGACLKNVVQIVVDGNASGAAPTTEKVFTTYLSGEENGLPMAGVRVITLDDKGGAWIGTYGGGAAYIDSTGKITVYNKESDIALPGTYINDIAIDKTGGVWLTLGGMDPKNQNGVAYLKDGILTQYTKENTKSKLLSDFVQTVEVDNNGMVWLGTALGLNKYNPLENKWNSWTKEDGLPAQSVSTLKVDDKGGVWIGAYPDAVDADSNVYSGGYAYLNSEGKIKVYKDKENTKFADQWVRNLSIDSEGGVWVVMSGSYSTMENVGGRVDYIAPDGEIKEKYIGHDLLPNELKDNSEIRTLTVDHKGSLWFGTSTQGIFFSKEPKKINKKFNSANLDWADTSSLDSIWTILVTEDAVWAGSNGGVATALSDDIFRKPSKFTDIKGHWAESHIEYLYSRGIVDGTGKNTFSPNRNITRAEFVKLLVSLLGDVDLKAASSDIFKDVEKGKWYTDYINWAAEKGITSGIGNDKFKPDDLITREQMAVMASNFIKTMKIELPEKEVYKEFKDSSQISAWAKDAVDNMQILGIINGKPDGTFTPKGLALRAEASTIIYKLYSEIK
ncbi:S-layer homology domain-containing protein [Proteiniborus sp.]|uniref:S-layer homology domain-containing protein n=1 Tax=Proteiniborus sp. TaxID=2079015 RepID=UPI00332425C5